MLYGNGHRAQKKPVDFSSEVERLLDSWSSAFLKLNWVDRLQLLEHINSELQSDKRYGLNFGPVSEFFTAKIVNLINQDTITCQEQAEFYLHSFNIADRDAACRWYKENLPNHGIIDIKLGDMSDTSLKLTHDKAVSVITNKIPIPWSSEFEIGVAEIDNDHRQLIDTLNLIISSRGGLDQDGKGLETGRFVFDVFGHLTSHFHFEEDLMERIDYPNLEMHKQEHRKVVRCVTDNLLAQKKLDILQASLENAVIILNWLVLHLMTSDCHLAKYMKAMSMESMSMESMNMEAMNVKAMSMESMNIKAVNM